MERAELMDLLKKRFEEHMERHPNVLWTDVAGLLTADSCRILLAMEESGGEPDVVDFGDERIIYVDCSQESPLPRRSLCYDRQALAGRKENAPEGSAVEKAAAIGARLLDENAYITLQKYGDFDLKSQSWILTPPDFRKEGDAFFGSKRHGRTFIFYNGAQSYYKTRGFRCMLTL